MWSGAVPRAVCGVEIPTSCSPSPGGGAGRWWGWVAVGWVSLPAVVVVRYEMLPHNPMGCPTTHSLPLVSPPPPTLRRYGGRLLPANPPSTLAMCSAALSLRLVHVEAASVATHDLRRASRLCLNLLSPRQTGRGIWTSCTGCKMDSPCRDDGSKPHGEVVWPANQPLNHPPAGGRLRA